LLNIIGLNIRQQIHRNAQHPADLLEMKRLMPQIISGCALKSNPATTNVEP
jgi:hypothetical protein